MLSIGNISSTGDVKVGSILLKAQIYGAQEQQECAKRHGYVCND